jgi:dipeptide/tripeptide permease
MVVVSFLLFVLIPNTLLAYLTTRMTPTGRDLVVATTWALGFVVACVIFVRLQPRRRS